MAVMQESERLSLRWESASQTHQGNVRKVNEDSVLSRPEVGLWVVADGMGGYETGDVASQMIVQGLSQILPSDRLSDFVNLVESCLLDVNQRILQHSQVMLDGRVAGSTVVALLINGKAGACVWAGDSRLYRLRDGRLQQLSRDHSQVEEMVERGELLAEDAEDHADANVITRAVGAVPELHVETTVFVVETGDIFLLCSDGLYKELRPADMEEILKTGEVGAASEALLETALDRGARDNVSIVLVKPI